jgi:PAS domain S-box-containing protein
VQDWQNPEHTGYEADEVEYGNCPLANISGPLQTESQSDPSQEALRKERDFTSAVLDTASALVVALDPQGRIVRFNKACERTTGYSFNEVRGKLLWDLFLIPEEVEPVKAVFKELRAGQFPNEYENQWLTKDGGRRLIAWSNTALLGANGAVEYVIGTGIDVTDRKHAEEALRMAHDKLELRVLERTAELEQANESLQEEITERRRVGEALRESESHLRSLMESAQHYAVYRIAFDPAHPYLARVVLASPSLKELLSTTDLYDLATWFANIHPDDLARCEEANRLSLETGVPFDEQFRVFKPERGTWRWVHDRSTPVFNSAGNLTHFNGLVVDITEQKQTQQALQQRLVSEELVARISSEFVNLGPAEIGTGIEHALQAIGQVAGVDRSYVFQLSGDGTILDNTHEWCAEGIQSYIDSLKGLPRAAFPWFVGRLEQLEVVAVPRVANLPPEASAERAECEREGIQSIILVPLTYRGMLTGFLGFDSVRSERSWGEDTVALLKTTAGIIVNALEHKRAQAIQAGQRQFLELLATGGDFSETLHSLVRLIEDQWPGMLGLILLLDEDGKHLHIGASVSLPQDYVQSIEGLEIGPMVGSCGTACCRRERVIVEDTATDPRWDGLRDLALQYSLRACWSEPVFSPSGQLVGTFAMYYRQPRSPTEAELRAIEMGAHLVGVATEHRRAEKALRESEGKFRGIIEYANVGIAIVQDARFRFVNPHFAAMLGYTVEEMLGTEYMGYCTPDERDRIVGYYTRRARGEPAPARYETAMVHKDGRWVYAEVSAGIIPYGGQQATFVSLRDITEERQAKQALEEAYQTLERRVEERTRELSTLLEVSKNLVSRLELEPLLGSILEELKSVVDYEGCMVFGLEGDKLVPRAHRGRMPQEKAMSLRWAVDDPLDRLVFRDREPVLVSDTREDSPTARAYRESVGELQETLYPHIRSWLGVPLIVKGQVIGELALDHSQPDFFTPAHASFAMAFANQAAVAIENARLYEAEQSRREEAERRRQVAEGMREILATLNSSRTLGEILNYIVDQASHLLCSDAVAIDRLDKQTELSTVRASRGLDADFAVALGFRVGQGSVAGEALLTRQPAMTSDLAARVAQMELPPEWRELAKRFTAQYSAMLAAPFFTRDGTCGALTLYYQSAHCFSEEEVGRAVTFADQAALAIENARLREQAEEAAAIEERGRLARELHDSVTQSLYSVTMYAEAAARLMTAGQETSAAEYLRDARNTAQEALREMRLLIYQLRPLVLEEGGLALALQVRLDAVERRGGIQAELHVEGQDRMPWASQGELYQIAMEALNNALKHAHARKVQVRLLFEDTLASLEVQDDGVGFEPAAAQEGGGLGIPGMTERVLKIGGRLHIASAPGQGTKVVVEVPTGGGK